jgi:flavin reductase (DIM6/NTAB) family NADH-FMN oxidoreductase RutF
MESKVESPSTAAPLLVPPPRPGAGGAPATPGVNGHHYGDGNGSGNGSGSGNGPVETTVSLVPPDGLVPPDAVEAPVVAVPLLAPVVAPPVAPEDFRAALRHFPAGVTIVTLRVGDEVHGLTVSAFASVSPVPPLVVVAIDHKHYAHELLQREGAVFGVNILHQGQRELADRFAWVKDEDRFAVGNWTTAVTGAPILADAAAWLDCTIHTQMPAGTHTLFIGEVRASGVPGADRPPLIYWSRSYRALDLAQG